MLPSPSLVSENCKQQGPFAPRTLLRFLATMSPSATLSSSTDFLAWVSQLYSLLLRRFAFALSVRARPLESSVFEATYAFTFVAAR